MEILGERGSALAKDQAPASLTTWLRPHEETEDNKIVRSVILKYRVTEINKKYKVGQGHRNRNTATSTTTEAPSPGPSRKADGPSLRAIDLRYVKVGIQYKKKHKMHRSKQSRNIRSYNKNRTRYNRWLENKGWRGTTADNRVPPRGTVGEPRHIRSMNANRVSNHAKNKPAESKPFERPRDTGIPQKQDTSE